MRVASRWRRKVGGMESVLLFGVVAVALTGLWVWALVDAVKTPDALFKAGNMLVWVLIIAVAGWLGAIIYVLVGRPAARRPPRRPAPWPHRQANDRSPRHRTSPRRRASPRPRWDRRC